MNRDDFERCFEQHRERVLAFAWRRVGPDDARDVVAETFLVAWRKGIPEDPLPYLFGIARKVISTHLRGKARHARLTTRLESHNPSSDGPREERLDLVGAFNQISDDDREVLMLIAWEGLTPEQAAEVLGCTPSNFSVRLHRARTRLEALLQRDEILEEAT